LDVAKDIIALFNLDSGKAIQFVDNRPFNDQRYYLDDAKLKALGWRERTSWEEGLRKTMQWYKSNPNWWGDVSRALVPHPRMLTIAGSEKLGELQKGEEDDDEVAIPPPRKLYSPRTNGAAETHLIKMRM
jgi:UDP-glucose 4,6-dehydratase